MPLALIPMILLSISCATKEYAEQDAQRIQALMNIHKSDIRQCYDEAAAKSDSFTGGKIRIRADQNPDGSLSTFREMESFADATAVTPCIEKNLKNWKVGALKTRGPIDLTWDFRYSAKSGVSQR
ncbi:MAG: hypothetical protein J0L93_09120 [Deltaproteobacteria bacterium]|nr:hypothetical protein [Deltaproteobacteria bacterium]